jgi:hypothetical protein
MARYEPLSGTLSNNYVNIAFWCAIFQFILEH